MTPTIYNIPLGNITTYLKGEGWHLVNDNERWFVFEGQGDANGDPFEIVLPKKTLSPEYPIYVQHTLDILSSLSDKSHDVIAEDINKVDLDVLSIRVDEDIDATSIPTDKAAEQIAELDQLVIYAATSEKTKKQHYQKPTSRVREMVEHVRFGHTVSGSFGFRIEAKIIDERQTGQLALSGLEPQPMARSVMERIVRGLVATETAVAEGNLRPLVEGYVTGFNSNMCKSIAKISSDSGRPVQYSIKWSRMLGVSKDLHGVTDITIQDRHIDYLKKASKQLALSEPLSEHTTVVGSVIGFFSRDDPHSDTEEGRTVTIYASPRGEHDRQILVKLGKEAYLAAMKAHDAWQTISVTGILSKSKNRWELSEPNEFKVLR